LAVSKELSRYSWGNFIKLLFLETLLIFEVLKIRLLAFRDKEDNKETLVLATHGFVKKTDKVPKKEIDRAVAIRGEYFESKKNKKQHGY
jgi:hypothetical protein